MDCLTLLMVKTAIIDLCDLSALVLVDSTPASLPPALLQTVNQFALSFNPASFARGVELISISMSSFLLSSSISITS